MAGQDYFDLQPNMEAPPKYLDSNDTGDFSCLKDNDTFAVSESALVRMPTSVNVSFVVLYLLMLGVAVIANSLTICVTYKGKQRLIYRFCLISLACSDLMITIASGLSSFPKFLQEAHNYWVMGEFLCSFLPFMQTMSVLASSMTLSCIAVDRYFVVTQALRTYWDPSGFACIACVVAMWVTSAGVAFPMYGHYMWGTAAVLSDSGQPCYLFNICMLKTKEVKFKYFVAVFTIIFLPLFCTFVVLYCLVMRFLWTRKRPGASKPFIATAGGGPGEAKAGSSAAGAWDSRKTRTVKAILALMVTFVCLRMPSWCFLLYTSVPNHQLTGTGWWFAQIVCSAMVLLNSAVNPFFYCFLAQVMSAWDSLTGRCCRLAGRSQPTAEAVVAPSVEGVKCCPLQSPHTMIPRGPYSIQESSGEGATSHQPRADGQNGPSTVTSSLNSSPRLVGKDARGPMF